MIETYNIPSFGSINANLFNHTESYYDFLRNHGHIKRLKEINQLGRLRKIFPGAHHTRFEYVFLKLALITELCKQNSNIGLSAEKNQFGKVNSLEKNPSLGELMQIASILLNIGYLPGTISTSKGFYRFLQINKDCQKKFISGIEVCDREKFVYSLKENNYYEAHIFIAMFLLQRYKRASDGHVELGTKILRSYLNRENEQDIQILKMWEIYDNVRIISFLTLDSLYAPVPFNLNLSSVILNFSSLYEDLFVKNSSYKIALNKLQGVLESSVYLTSDCALTVSNAANIAYHYFSDNKEEFEGLKKLKNLLKPSIIENDDIFGNDSEKDWDKKKKVILKFKVNNKSLEHKINEYNYEGDITTKIGVRFIRVGLLKNKDTSQVVLAAGLINNEKAKQFNIALNVVKEFCKFINNISDSIDRNENNDNEYAIFNFLMKSLFGWQNRFIFSHPNNSKPYIMTNGRIDAIDKINKYRINNSISLTKDDDFEIQSIISYLDQYKFSGLMLIYVGSLKIYLDGKTVESTEFDGVIFYPTKNKCVIIEAKNKANGSTEARTQLDNRLKEIKTNYYNHEITDIDGKSVFAEITV